MKKLVLVVGALVSGIFSSFAQLGSNFIYDDFQTVSQYGGANSGVYWFRDTNLPIYYGSRNGNGAYVLTQNTSTIVGTLATIDGTPNTVVAATTPLYAVVGVTLGPGNYVDLSGNSVLKFDVNVPANANATNLDLTFQITDINGKQISIQPDTVVGACAWGAGGSKSKYQTLQSLGTSSVVTFNFANGYIATSYSCGSQCACPSVSRGFDYTKVKQIEFLVSGGCKQDNTVPCYNGTFTVSSFSLGAVPTKLAAPNPTAATTANDVTISWPAVSGATLYNIISSSNSTTGFDIVATTTATSWTTSTSGTAVSFYKVSAFNGINSYSATKQYTAGTVTNSVAYELSSAVSVAPNPSSEGYINVNTDLNVSNIAVMNAQGALVNAPVNGNRVNTSNLTPGVYTLLIDTEKGRTAKKVVVE